VLNFYLPVCKTLETIPTRLIPVTRSVVALALLVAGCSPEAARRSADLQVEKILRDRTQTTLGYDPQTSLLATTPDDPAPPARAYARLPVTPLPPPAPSPIEPATAVVPFGPLGPSPIFPRNMGAVDPSGGVAPQGIDDPLGVIEASRNSLNALLQGPPAPGERRVVVDLFKAIDYGVNHSRAYQDRMDQLYLAALDVTLQRHLFTPRPFVTTGLDFVGNQQDLGYQSALNATQTVGVRQRLPQGGEIVASGLVRFVNALNDNTESGESAQVALRGTIPLLRGAGFVNLEPLVSTERNLVYAVRSFEDFRRDYAVQVSTAYFRLLSTQQAVTNRQGSVRNLTVLTERTQALYDAGRISFLEVQRAYQSLLSGQNRLVVSQASYESAVDDFKILIGMPVEQELEIVGVRLDVQVPDIDRSDITELAMKYRLDLQTARDQLDDARRRIDNAENGLLPDLNLTAGAAVGSRLETPAGNVDSRTTQYDAGVTLDLPVDRLAERNVYRAALVNFARSQRNVVTVRDNILADVRESVRQIRAAQTTLNIQQTAIDLAVRRLDYSNELLRQGRTDARNVVEAQDSLLTAQDAYEVALADLQIQVLQLLRRTGTLRVDPESGSIGRAMDRQ